jgi:hypothetical protein
MDAPCLYELKLCREKSGWAVGRAGVRELHSVRTVVSALRVRASEGEVAACQKVVARGDNICWTAKF